MKYQQYLTWLWREPLSPHAQFFCQRCQFNSLLYIIISHFQLRCLFQPAIVPSACVLSLLFIIYFNFNWLCSSFVYPSVLLVLTFNITLYIFSVPTETSWPLAKQWSSSACPCFCISLCLWKYPDRFYLPSAYLEEWNLLHPFLSSSQDIWHNLLKQSAAARATFVRVTDWEGKEHHARHSMRHIWLECKYLIKICKHLKCVIWAKISDCSALEQSMARDLNVDGQIQPVWKAVITARRTTIPWWVYHVESFEWEGTFKGHPVQLTCNEQGHLQLNQAAQGSIRERLHGWSR